jgi:hypothetical protein
MNEKSLQTTIDLDSIFGNGGVSLVDTLVVFWLFLQALHVHQYLRSFSFASPKENEPKEKATQKNAALRAFRGTPAFLGGQRSNPI